MLLSLGVQTAFIFSRRRRQGLLWSPSGQKTTQSSEFREKNKTFHMAEIRPPFSLISVEFEIFGKVQGVFFRKCTRDQGSKLGLKGWCRNTESGTVEGILEGSPEQVNMMKEWLRYKGSPQSRIDKAEFRNEKAIESLSFTTFGVKK